MRAIRQVTPGFCALIGLSLDALDRHRLRTVLGTTGIVIGIVAVTAMLSVAEGGRREVIRQVELLGLHNAVIRPRPGDPGQQGAPGRPTRLGPEDIERLRVLLPQASGISPLVERFEDVDGPADRAAVAVIAVALDYERMMRLQVVAGRLIAPLDVERDAQVCLLGASVSSRLFGASSPLGATLRLANSAYVVVGVLGPRGGIGTPGATLSPRDLDSSVIVPASRRTLAQNAPPIAEVWLQFPEAVAVTEAGEVAARALNLMHRNDAGVELFVPEDLLRQRLGAQRTFNVVLGTIGALSLLVGGIGIMNMMLASVLERTSEIGLRRTVGATERSIAMQFLAESAIMTATGGVVGVILGAAASVLIAKYADWPSHVSFWAVVSSLLLSTLVGLVFGTYPALRAARLQPIEAVRYE